MPFKIIAHRGASADAKDNTAEAFQLAIEQQSDLIETDVRITADGVLVLEHNGTIKDHIVLEHTLNQLRALDPNLMTVAQALARFGSVIPFCWEIKAPGVEAALVNLVYDLVPDHIWQQTEFTSFWIESVASLRRHAPENPVGWLTREWSQEAIGLTREWGGSQICPTAQAILTQPELVEVAHQAGLTVRSWLIREPEEVPRLAALGVYGGTCNWPAAARQARDA